jgi:hypothetical protein
MTSRRNIASAVLGLMKSEPWVTDAEKNFRMFMKSLNRLGGGIVFEVLDRNDIEHFCRIAFPKPARSSSCEPKSEATIMAIHESRGAEPAARPFLPPTHTTNLR